MNGVVIKAGGSSLSGARNIENVADITIDHYLANLDVGLNAVMSAFGVEPGKKDGKKEPKVTDILLTGANYVLNGNLEKALGEIAKVRKIHYGIVDELVLDRKLAIDKNLVDANLSKLEQIARDTLDQLNQGTAIEREKLLDMFAASGELISTPIVAAVVQRKLEAMFSDLESKLQSSGLRRRERRIYEQLKACEGQYVVVVEDPGTAGFVTDSKFTNATLLDRSLETEIANYHRSLRERNRNRIIFYPGFVGRDENGNRTTLGRDGSNVTAIALAAAIGAQEIIIYSDKDGILLVDERIRPSKIAEHLSYSEVTQLAQNGGMKVLQENSLEILRKTGAKPKIYVRNSFNPENPGTLITPEPIKARSSMKGIGVLSNLKDGQGHEVAHVTVCGEGLGNSNHDISKIKTLLGLVYQEPEWYASHPLVITGDTIQMAVRQQDVRRVVDLVYNQLKRLNIVLYGLGDIGLEFLKRVKERYDELGLNVVGVLDTSGVYAKLGGFSSEDLESMIAQRSAGKKIKDMKINGAVYTQDRNFKNVYGMGTGDFVVVDATPDENMDSTMLHALSLGASGISVNKKPYAKDPTGTRNQDWLRKNVDKLFSAMFDNRLFIRGTVGADLGVHGTLLDILAENPPYVTVQVCFSGRLGYTYAELERGITLSQAVQASIDHKITQSNSFEDYSGLGVLEKVIILWRTIARKYGIDIFDCVINHERFIDAAIKRYEQKNGKGTFPMEDINQLDSEQFVQRLRLLDGSFAELQAEAGKDYLLKYVGEISYNTKTGMYSINVGLKKVPKDSAFGRLKGKDNIVLFGVAGEPSEDNAIVVGPGSGAGIEETASAMMHDLDEISKIVRGESPGRQISYVKYKPIMRVYDKVAPLHSQETLRMEAARRASQTV
ncbi:hypothetical protein HYX02_03455 [Candidatus Woesearchaeota archaeon]|nr:hypothetical protein [Candidatus Woesearchaeota archaeon]